MVKKVETKQKTIMWLMNDSVVRGRCVGVLYCRGGSMKVGSLKDGLV
jgi:hypothetical protein